MPASPKTPDYAAFRDMFEGAEVTGLRRRETDEERMARLTQEAGKIAHDQWKEKAILIAVMVVVGVILVIAVAVLMLYSPQTQPDASRWATGALSTILGAVLGLLGGG